jgi:hypothetical protein
MEINKFNQTMKYLTRPAERPAKVLSDNPIETPPVFKTSDPKEAIKEVIRRTEGQVPGVRVAPGISFNPLGTVEDQDPSLTGKFDVGGGKLEFGVKEDEGFVGFRKEFDEGGVIGGGMIEGEDLGSRTGFKMVVNVSKLEKLKDLIEESNQRLDKINIKQLYLDAGYGAKGLKKGSEAAQLIKNNLLTNEERIQKRYDLILNAPEDTPAEKLFNPVEKISKDMGLKRPLVSNTLNKYEPYQDTKQIRNFLTKDGFQRLAKNKNYTWGDVLDIAANRLDTSGEIYNFSRGSPEDRILNYAKMHFEKNRGTGKSKIKFLTDPKTTPRRDWEFTYKGKKFTADDIFRKGRTFKEFKEIYDLADKIDSVQDRTINVKGKTISVEDYLKQAYGQGTGKKGYYQRTPFDIDHIEGISKDPFKNLRILPARINKGGGSINLYADKFGDVSKALKKIGYDYNQSFESLLENELKLADDIFTRGRKLRSFYEIASQTKSTKFKGTQKPILDPQIDPRTGKLKPVKPGEGFAKVSDKTMQKIPRTTPFYSFPANLPEMTKTLAQDVSKASSTVARGLDNLKLLRPLGYQTGFGAATIGPLDFLGGRPVSEILLDIPTLGIAGQSLRAQKLRQTVGPEVFDKIQEQRAARSEGIGGIESTMFEDFGVDETPLEEAIQARADREAAVAKTRKIQDVSEMDIMGLPKALKKDREQEIKRDESLDVDDKELL